MRRFLRLLIALTLACTALPASAFDAAAVLRSAGYGDIFSSFGQAIVSSPRQQGVTDERFLRAWEGDVSAAFGSATLNEELAARLGGTLAPTELDGIADFLGSPFGLRVAALEHEAQAVPPDEQLAVLAKGQMLYWRISETRRVQFDELMRLSGMEVSFAILSETLRAAAVSLHMAQDKGDLDVPWEEIDAGVGARLTGMRERLVEATRATFAYTYEALTDDELEAYLVFLREPAAQRFYGTATLAVGEIIHRTMLALGKSVAARLNAVHI